MSNVLENGTVLPFGLLSGTSSQMNDAFKKTYQNTSLRVGIVIQSYAINDDNNISKVFAEYDVMTFEQNEDQGSTTITYKHCPSASGFGSISDFFEANLRKLEKKTTKGVTPQPSGQNGAIVLLLCLNGMSDTGIIIGSLAHPDRKTTLVDGSPHLEGEYNGVHIVVNSDGSTSFTFKGATDNDGKIIDTNQGPTEIKVEKDGSYQLSHKTIMQRFDKGGDASLNADGNISNTAKKDFNATATGGINLTATKDLTAKMVKFVAEASGSASFACQEFKVDAQSSISMKGSEAKIEAQGLASIKAPQITMDGLTYLGGSGGQPVLLLTSLMLGTGNLGMPVISNPISGYAVKTFAN